MVSRQNENKLKKEYEHVIGIDISGITAKAGPLIGVGLEMTDEHQIYKVEPARKMDEEEEYKFFKKIWNDTVNLTISEVENREITSFGKRNSAKICMERVISHHLESNDLDPDDCIFLLDFFDIEKSSKINKRAIKRGDEKEYIIACASIVADILQKQYMKRIHSEFPIYNWNENYGYEDEEHLKAIEKHGKSLFHR